MQAVFHPSQPNVQYPRYSSEHETKAAAAEATDIQPANSHTHTCHSTSLIWRFNLTFVAVCANNHRYPFKSFLENQLWEIEILKHMQAARVVIIRMAFWRRSAQAWSFISVAEMRFRCSELTVQKSTKPSPALCRRTNRKPGEKTDVLTDHSWSKVDIGHDSTKGPRVILSCVKTLLPNCSWQVQSRIFQVFQTKKWNAEVVFAGLHCAQTANVR